LATYSEDWTNYWNTALNVTWSGNVSGTTDPYGTNVADAMFETSANDNHAIFADYSVTSGTTYTFSFFVKSIIARNVRINGSTNFPAQSTDVNLSTLAISGAGSGTCRVLNFGNGWARISQTYTATGTGNGRFIIYSMSGTTQSFQGSTNNGLYFFGAQLETGSIATSYIPTTTASATRNADVISLSGAVSGCIGQTEGTLYAEIVARPYNNALFPSILEVDDGTDTQRFAIFVNSVGGIRVRLNASGISETPDSLNPTTLVVGQTYKIAAAFGFNGSIAFYINGVFQVSGSVTAGPFTAALNRVMLGQRGGIVSPFLIRSAAIYTTRLTNAQLAALTTL